MGRSVTPKYAVEFAFVVDGRGPCCWTPQGWNSKQAGRPTAANLAAFVKGYEASTQPGQVNAHLSPTKIGFARIVLNDGSKTMVAEFHEQKAEF